MLGTVISQNVFKYHFHLIIIFNTEMWWKEFYKFRKNDAYPYPL